jgi:hypothetical protein
MNNRETAMEVSCALGSIEALADYFNAVAAPNTNRECAEAFNLIAIAARWLQTLISEGRGENA